MLLVLRQQTLAILFAIVNLQLVLEADVIKIRILTNLLAPRGLIVEVNVLALTLAFGELLSWLCSPEPGLVFFVEHPVLFLKLYRR